MSMPFSSAMVAKVWRRSLQRNCARASRPQLRRIPYRSSTTCSLRRHSYARQPHAPRRTRCSSRRKRYRRCAHTYQSKRRGKCKMQKSKCKMITFFNHCVLLSKLTVLCGRRIQYSLSFASFNATLIFALKSALS